VVSKLSLVVPYVRKYKGEFVQGVVTLVLASSCSAAIPFLIKNAVDALQVGLRTRLLHIIGLASLLACAQAFLRWRSRMKILNSAREIEYELRRDFYTHIISLPYSFFKEHHRGDLIARVMNDIINVRMMVGMSILHFSSTVATTLLSLIMMIRINALIAVLAILPLCLLFVLVRGYMEKLHTIFKDVQDTYGRLSKGANEVLNGIRLVKNYLLHSEEQRRFEALNREYMEKNLASTRLWGIIFPAIGFLGGMGTLVVMWVGGYFLMYGKITLGDFIALNAYYTMLMWPVVALAWIMNLYQRGVASLKRLEEIRAYQVESELGANPEHLKGHVEFSHVSVTKGERRILNDVSFAAMPGEKLLLIGPTGSGKTTVLNLILGLENGSEGAIRIDGLNADLLSPSARRGRIATVPQEPFLYSLPIRENIFSDDLVQTIINTVGLQEEIDRFEQKLETVVGERGVMLSGGQKQRLTIARALAAKPDILLLDDPFTHVDGYTEHLIWERIWPLIKGLTVIITSTRPVPIIYVDRVAVLSEGSVIEEGNPTELLARSHYMKLLYEVKAARG